MTSMKPYHFRMLSFFLEEFSNLRGSASCNDLDLQEFGLKRHEMDELYREYHQYNGDPEEYEPGMNVEQLRRCVPDFCAVSLLRHKMHQMAEIMYPEEEFPWKKK